MPLWIQYILGAAGVVTALGILLGVPVLVWKKILRPGAKLITTTDEMLPLLQKLTEVFKGTPNSLTVLSEIAAQFRTDSGSSLRDVVNRLETAAQKQAAIAEQLRIGAETSKQMAELDRATVRRVEIFLDRLGVKVDAGAATGMRIEHAAGLVADDLAASHKRADEVDSEHHGAAADAAAMQTPREKLKEEAK